MSATTIIWTLLKSDSGVIALVPQARIVTGILPQNTTLPALAVSLISGTDMNIPNPAAKIFVTERVQVTVLANNYTEQLNVMDALRKACRDQHGTIAGFSGVGVTTDVRGADAMYGQLTGIFMQTQDFKVTYSRAP